MNSKKVFKNFWLCAAIVAVFFGTAAFTSSVNADEESCTVTVYYKNGSLADNLTVSIGIFDSVLGQIGTADFKTNSDGVATLKWNKKYYVKKVYVKGDGYKVDYRNGERYTLRLEVNR